MQPRPKLAPSIEQGCLCHVRELTAEMGSDWTTSLTLDHFRSFARAIRKPGALQALEVLDIYTDDFPSGAIKLLAGALTSGAAPSLRHLGLGYGYSEDKDVEAMDTMLEAGTQNPACHALEMVDGDLFTGGSDQVSDRMMRALLPSVTELKLEYWDDTYHRNEACYTSVRPLHLKKLEIQFMDDQGRRVAVPPSVAMLESMPALETLSYWGNLLNSTTLEEDLEPIILALNRSVAFRQLQALYLTSYHLGDAAAWDRMLYALAGAACARWLTSLDLGYTSFSLKTLSTLSTLLSKNTFPMLQALELTDSPLGDRGVEILVRGLLAPSCGIRLTKLNLDGFQFGDHGMAALARVVLEGRFERLRKLKLSCNSNVTNQGVRVLVRAVQERLWGSRVARALVIFGFLAAAQGSELCGTGETTEH